MNKFMVLLLLVLLTGCTEECDADCKAQGEARMNEILKQRANIC
jgi:hypothetical protein